MSIINTNGANPIIPASRQVKTALSSSAADHIIAIAEDIYDVDFVYDDHGKMHYGAYQSEINKALYKGKQTKLIAGKNIEISDDGRTISATNHISLGAGDGIAIDTAGEPNIIAVKADGLSIGFDGDGRVESKVWGIDTATPDHTKTVGRLADVEFDNDTTSGTTTGKINGKVIITAPTIAGEYDETSTYQIDDVVYHDNVLYACNTKDTTGAWDASKWNVFSTPILDELRNVEQVTESELRILHSGLLECEEVTAAALCTLNKGLIDDEDVVAKALVLHRDTLLKKQDLLTAGTGVTIEKVGDETVISAAGKSYQAGNGINITDATTATPTIQVQAKSLGGLAVDAGGIKLATPSSSGGIGISSVTGALYIKLPAFSTTNGPGLKLNGSGLSAMVDGTTISFNSSGALTVIGGVGKTYQAGTNITIDNPTSSTPTINASALEASIPLVTVTTASTSYTLDPGTYYVLPTNQSSYTIALTAGSTSFLHSYMFEFTTTSTATTSLVTLPSGVNWVLDPPTDAGTYQVSITRTMATYIMY